MNKYLVTYECEGKIFAVIETANEIFNKMDMSDCYDINIIHIEWLKEWESVQEFRLSTGYPICEFFGTWSCKNPETGKIDPLRMEIRMKFGDMRTLDVGYGTDH